MYLALFSVVFGSVLTFVQAAALFRLLDLDNYVAFRAVLNTMNVAAPFLCLGFDSAAPMLRRQNPEFPFFWNLLIVHLVLFGLFTIASLSIAPSSKLQPLLLGLAASTSLAAALLVANYHRVEGAIRKYFISINIVDKLVRTFVIIGLAILVVDVKWWSISVSALLFLYVGWTSRQTQAAIKLDAEIFIKHVGISIPYVFSALGIVVLTRMPFYSAYLLESEKSTVAKIDIWLLFSLFLLIPVLNKSKIEEAASAGISREYITAMRQSWVSLHRQELLVCGGILVGACLAVLSGFTATTDLLSIVLPLMAGMILIASQPNYAQLLCFTGRYKLGIKISLLVGMLSIAAYLPRLVFNNVSIPLLFVLSSVMYCSLGRAIAWHIGIEGKDFWRWREALILIACSAAALTAANSAFGGESRYAESIWFFNRMKFSP